MPGLQNLSARSNPRLWVNLLDYMRTSDMLNKFENINTFPGKKYEMPVGSILLYMQTELETSQSFANFAGGYNSPAITALAIQLTEGFETDYEKAVALEEYFRGFTYNLNFKPEREDIEYFLLESQTGACVEFATAMTLMARAIGLNARYVEGFIAKEQNEEGQFVVRESHGHAFTQIFFAPYGWVTFEPTQGQIFEQPQENNVFQGIQNIQSVLQDNVLSVFAILSIACVLGFTTYVFYIYLLAEKLFRRKALKTENSQAIIMLFKKMHQIAEITNESNLSARQLTELIQERCGTDISAAAAYYERVMYNNEKLCNKSKKEVYNIYLVVYALRKRFKSI
jgi:hypothetical protein